MDKQFTTGEVRELAKRGTNAMQQFIDGRHTLHIPPQPNDADMVIAECLSALDAYAYLLEAREKAVPVAWRSLSLPTTFICDAPKNLDCEKWQPLYTHPAPSDAERLADETALRHGWAYSYSGSNLYGDDGELQDNAAFPHIDWLRDSVQELHQKVAKRGAAKLAAHSAQAQPPAASVPGELAEPSKGILNYEQELSFAEGWNACRKAMLAAQKNK